MTRRDESGPSLERLIGVIDDACLVLDNATRVSAANTRAHDMYGIGDLVGRQVSDLCPDEDVATHVTKQIAACNGTSRAFTAHQRRGDGTLFLGDFSASRYEDSDTHSTLLLVRSLEDCLVACETNLVLHSALLDAAVDAIIAYTPEGELVYANAAARDRWDGVTPAQIRAAGPFGWIPVERRARARERARRICLDGELRFESRGSGQAGEPLSIEVHSRLLDTPIGPLIMANIRDVADRAETEEMVRYLAYHDTLTGLANRVALDSELAHSISSSNRHGDLVGIVFLDLDDFKPVNDTHGHTLGDQVLREVADRIAGSVRDTDTVARIGGDEFVVLLPRLRLPHDLVAIAQNLVAEVARPIKLDEVEIRVTASCGLAIHKHGEDAERFLTRADLAMYESRQRGVHGWDLPTL